jgi:formylglycine-generating enzyme required for sulfatase activity/tRNA A-37 threonylcarbamoyl transferase component Bud32
MLIYKKTSTLAVRHVLLDPQVIGTMAEVVVKDGAKVLGRIAEEAAGKVAGEWARKVVETIRGHFTNHSEKLTEALARSNEKAWKTIEIALGGQRLWDRFASAEDHALREQVKAFLTSAVKEDDPGYLTSCLKELRQAREKGHLTATNGFRPESLAEDVGPFARFDDPEALLAAESNLVEEVARELQRLGYRDLGRLLAVKPTRGQPLLAMAAQYYFRRAVGEDAILARELTWTKLIAIDRRLEDGFAFLALMQERHGRTLEEALDKVAGLEDVVVETRDAVLSLHEKFGELADLYKLSHRPLTASHSLSYRDDHEKTVLEAVKRRYRSLSDDQRRRFPQLGLDLSRLEIVAGDFQDALGQAREAASQLDEPTSKAEAYRAALELKSWDEALAELRQAAAANRRFAIWPSIKYQVERILGAGAFGVALLCQDTYLEHRVVIKTFDVAGIDRDVATIFREARILLSLKHAGIINLYSCGFVDEVRKQRPYLEIAHFPESLTLEDHLHRHGPLTPDDLLPVAIQTAEALKAAHEAGVWHRDVKPGNLLVRKTARGWEVKVIDFGLSLRRSLVQTAQARAASDGRSMFGSSVAGTLHYAAPEQLDPGRSKEVGPHSDVFGFGRTCYFALFGEPYPDQEDLDSLPQPWREFLGRCTAGKKIERRPGDFAAVLVGLRAILEPIPHAPPAPPPVIPATPDPVSASPVTQAISPAPKPTPKPDAAPRFENDLGMTMVRIEPGAFDMGSTKAQIDMLVKQFPDTKREWFDAEQPQHPVKITRPFYLAAHQVTVGQFRRFVEKSGYETEAEKAGEKQNWREPGFAQGDDHPVVYVSHNDAVAFLGWLNQQENEKKRGYRLPTEAEWEYACRAGTRGLYGGEDDPKSLARIANLAGDADGFKYTSPVGSFAPNAWQLYDMIGNVWEWCDDWYNDKFYQPSPKEKSPRENPHNTAGASSRVFRGGSWYSAPRRCRPANRRRGAPEYRDITGLGFRLAAVQE